jgi:Uma2 family endonuclease
MTALLDRPRPTPEDLLYLSRDHRYELVNGRLVEKSMAATSSAVVAEVLAHLNNFVRDHQAGLVLAADQGYQCFPDEPNKVRKPDISFIARDRITPALAEGHIRIAPDLVVEVLSPTDLVREVSRRIRDYLRVGVRLLWVIDPEARLVQVYRPGRRGVILPETDELDGEEVLPGFRVPVHILFRPLALLQPETTTPAASS